MFMRLRECLNFCLYAAITKKFRHLCIVISGDLFLISTFFKEKNNKITNLKTKYFLIKHVSHCRQFCPCSQLELDKSDNNLNTKVDNLHTTDDGEACQQSHGASNS